jgi:hypothetical protein
MRLFYPVSPNKLLTLRAASVLCRFSWRNSSIQPVTVVAASGTGAIWLADASRFTTRACARRSRSANLMILIRGFIHPLSFHYATQTRRLMAW